MAEKTALIQLNSKQEEGKEQYKVFQLNGKTIRVPVGKIVEVPLWVAIRAKEIGDIDNYQEK